MPDRDDDLPANAPSIVPDRDDVEQYQRQKAAVKPKAAAEPATDDDLEDYDDAPAPSKPSYLLIGAAVAALAWAGFLQFQVMGLRSDLDNWQMRVADLEKRLSVTDESSNQSAAATQVKLKDLEDNLDKLRDDSFKKAKATLDQHSAQLATIDQNLKAAQGTVAKVDKAVDEHQKTLDATKGQLDKIAPTVELSKRKLEEQQAAIESLTEKGNVTSAGVEKLNLRMNTNEEWVQSINNFRKQTNRELVNIKQQIGGPVKETAPK